MSSENAFIILMMLLSNFAYCQQQDGFKLTGIVLFDEDHTAVYGADVVVRSAKDSTLITGVVTDKNGRFEISVQGQYNYLISVYFMGMEPYKVTKTMDGDFDLGTISLARSSVELSEVKLKATIPTIERKIDKVVVNVATSIYSTGENLYNLMNIIPEVKTDGLGNINFRGQQGVILYVDRRRIWLSGQQLMSYLRAIPSESIKNMEVSSVPGAQYDATGTVAIINIVTKREYRYGISGNVNSYYEQHRYPGVGGGTLLNYRTGKFNFQLNYSYSLFNFYNDIVQEQTYEGAEPFVFNQDDTYRETYNNHSSEFAVDYAISEKHKVGVRYRLNYVDWDMNYHSNTEVYSVPSNVDSLFVTKNTESELLNNQSLTAYYDIALDTMGSRLSSSYEVLFYNNPSNAFYKSDFLYPDGSPIREVDSSFIDNPIKVNIQIGKLDFEKSFKKKWKLQAGSKLSFIDTDNSNLFYTGMQPNINVDSQRSNQFLYNEDIYAFYGSVQKEWDAWSISGGLRMERTVYSGNSITSNTSFNKNRLDFFPTLFFQRQFGENHSLNLSYGRRILRPAYEYLNPFIDYETPYSYSTGNPDLQPAFANSIELSYLYKKKYYFNMGYKNTASLVGEMLEKDSDGLTVVSTYSNLSDEHYYFLSSSIPIKVTDWYSINNYLNLYYKEVVINKGDLEGTYSQATLFYYMSHSFNLKNDFYLELNGYYQSKNIYSIYEINPQGTLNFTVKKSFLDQKLHVNASLYDIFYTQKSKTYANFDDINRISSSKFTSQMFKLSLSYNFSSGKRDPEIHEIEAPGEDEEDRIE